MCVCMCAMLFSLSSPFGSPMDRAFRFFFASIWSKPKRSRRAEWPKVLAVDKNASGVPAHSTSARSRDERWNRDANQSGEVWERERRISMSGNLYIITRSTARDLHRNAYRSHLQLLLSPIRWKSKLRTCSWGIDRIMTFWRGTFCGYYYHAHMVIQKTEASLCTRKYGFVV